MFVQNDVYPASEYGTRECPEDREPCGAFYGLPFSGEIEDMPIFEADQLREAMPNKQIRIVKTEEKPKIQAKYDPEYDIIKAEDVFERDRLATTFRNTYNTHYVLLRKRFSEDEYIAIRFKLIKNKGRAL